MSRLTGEQLEALIKKEGVNRIWSWSKINCFHTSCYEYYLKYIKKAKEDRADSIYTTTGGLAHNILEKFYMENIIIIKTQLNQRFMQMVIKLILIWQLILAKPVVY